jgi:hypothetical protein
MTSAPSAQHQDQLTLFAGDFLARTSAKPEKAPAWLARDRDCFTNCSEPFAWWDRDTSCWKTSQRSLTEEWTTFSERWPRQGMTRNGRAYRQRLWVPVISEIAGGALPTPVAQTGAGGPKGLDGGAGARQMLADAGFPRAAGAPSSLPTPTTNDAKNASLPPSQAERDGLAGHMLRNNSIPTGAATYLNPSFVEEMMGFPVGWTV